MNDGYIRLASKLEDAIDAVHYAKKVRDEENIEQFGDLDLILAELRSLHERASNTRFAREDRFGKDYEIEGKEW